MGSDSGHPDNHRLYAISIHAPRVGSDRCILDIIYLASTHFYPRSPRGERLGTRKPYHVRRNFYPRSPRGERPNKCKIDQQCCSISIHAPRVGSDCWYIAGFSAYRNFYPRSPRGERLNEDRYGQQFWRISIHAPRVGSDLFEYIQAGTGIIFLSTLPAWGATCGCCARCHCWGLFLSTLPAWGATLDKVVLAT